MMNNFKSELRYLAKGLTVLLLLALIVGFGALMIWLGTKYIVFGWVIVSAIMLFMILSIAYMIGKTMEW
jgi:hypothetical protein